MWRLLLIGIPALALADPNFHSKVRPILEVNCVANATQRKLYTSSFSIDTFESVLNGGAKYGAAVAPGDPEKSPLVKILKGELKPQMPFGKSLSATDIAVIEEWIKDLKPSDAWLRLKRGTLAGSSGRKPEKSDPPKVVGSGLGSQSIDGRPYLRSSKRKS